MSDKYIFAHFSFHFCCLFNQISNQLDQVFYPLEFLTFACTLEAQFFEHVFFPGLFANSFYKVQKPQTKKYVKRHVTSHSTHSPNIFAWELDIFNSDTRNAHKTSLSFKTLTDGVCRWMGL